MYLLFIEILYIDFKNVEIVLMVIIIKVIMIWVFVNFSYILRNDVFFFLCLFILLFYNFVNLFLGKEWVFLKILFVIDI